MLCKEAIPLGPLALHILPKAALAAPTLHLAGLRVIAGLSRIGAVDEVDEDQGGDEAGN